MARIILYTILISLSISCGIISGHESEENDVQEEEIKLIYKTPEPSGFAHLAESFDDEEKFKKLWIESKAKKEDIDEDIAKYDGVWSLEEPKRHPQSGDLGLVLKSKAKHAAISALLSKPFYFEDKPLVVQYEVNFQEGQECGGAYLKLISLEQPDLEQFHDKTPYTIMFGPDKCGNDHKLHFIFRHKNPLNGSIEEKHAKKPKERLEDFFKDKQPHLYTLIVRPDNTYEIKIDNKVVNSGSLLDDFTPPVNPPLEIEDPDDKQPEDWDDREKIPDPLAVKPEDWDENAPAQIVDEDDVMPEGWLENEPPMIPNPDAVKPEDWDIEMDGEWEPPEIPNPKCADVPGCGPYQQRMKKNPRYKGKWLAPLIDNPNYKGTWKPRLIHNPNYFNDENPFKMLPVFAIGFELWSMSPDILFDNIIITDDEQIAQRWADDSFEVKRVKIAEESWSVWRQVATFTSEHPWMWAIYILAVGVPLLLLIYCCCFSSQDKQDEKEDEKPSMDPYDLLTPADSNMDDPSEEKENDNKEEFQDDVGEAAESTEEVEEIIESTNTEEVKKSQEGGDGPRRRKPNKE